jgi:hypothetical protein
MPGREIRGTVAAVLAPDTSIQIGSEAREEIAEQVVPAARARRVARAAMAVVVPAVPEARSSSSPVPSGFPPALW